MKKKPFHIQKAWQTNLPSASTSEFFPLKPHLYLLLGFYSGIEFAFRLLS